MGERVKESVVLLAVVLLSLAVVFPACGVKDPPGAMHMVYGAIGEPETLDPAWSYDTASRALIFNVYEGLLFFDGEHVDNYRPQLAASLVIEDIDETDPETGLTWTARYCFETRVGVGFHGGGILTPSDAEYSIERGMVQDRLGGPQWMFFLPLLNHWSSRDLDVGNSTHPGPDVALMGKMIDNAVQSNSTHVWLNAVNRLEWLLQVLSQPLGSVISRAWAVGIGDWPGTWGDYTSWVAYNDPTSSPIDLLATYPTGQDGGTGPFKLDYWNEGTEYSLVRSADYWGRWPASWPAPSGIAPAGYIERFTGKYIADWASRKPQFIAGDLDLCDIPRSYVNDPELVAAVNAGAISLVNPLPEQSIVCGHFNFNISTDSLYMPTWANGTAAPTFFSDIHIRRGFAYAFNFTNLIEEYWLSTAVQPHSWHIEGLAGPTIPNHYSMDLTKAADEFKQAFGGTVESPGPAWTQGFTAYITAHQASLAIPRILTLFESGIESIPFPGTVDIVKTQIPWSTFLDDLMAKRLPTWSLGWMAEYAHPDNLVRPYMHSLGDYSYFQSYNNATVDMMIDEAVKLPLSDPTAQAYYWELQLEFYRSVPTIPMYQHLGRHYEQAWVQGWYYNPLYPGCYIYSMWKQDVTAGNVNYDGVVDMRDIGAIARAFGSYAIGSFLGQAYGSSPIHPRWNFRCDLVGDRKIDMRDISAAARNYGKP